ncbi:MAG: PAS domain S-box protein [Chlorobium sp.]|nr:PAS domain S-box protein [Chlorobium sp.]
MENRLDQSAELRKRAESVLEETFPSGNIANLSPEELQKTVHDLQVHQIELEMQNEELRRTQAKLDASHARYFDFYNLAPVGYLTISQAGLILEVNRTAASLLGTAQSVLVNQPITHFILKEDQDLYYLYSKNQFKTNEPQECDVRMVREDDSVFWARLRAIAAQDADGTPVCRVVLSDITDHKRVEEALKESELRANEEKERLSCLLNSISDEVWFADIHRQCTLANPSAVREFNLSSPSGGDVVKLAESLEVYRGDGTPRPPGEAPLLRALTGELIRGEEEIIRTPHTSNLRHRQVSAAPVYCAKGNIIGSISVVRDITDLKQVEKALRESHAKLEAALASMTDAVFITDAQGQFLNFNEAFATFHKFKSKDECAKNLAGYPDILEVFMANGEPAPLDMWPVPRALRDEAATNAEYILRRKDSGETWVGNYSFGPIRDANGSIVGSVVSGRDITKQKQVETMLKESEERFRLLFENHTAVKLVIDAETGHIVDANNAAVLFYGWPKEQLTRMSIQQINTLPVETVKAEMEKASKCEKLRFEFRHRLADGSIREVEVFSNNIEISGKHFLYSIIHDITDRKKAEKALRESEVNQREQEVVRISEARFREVLEHSLDASYKRNLQTESYDYLSPVFTQISGYTPEEVITLPTVAVLGLVHLDDQPGIEQVLSNAISDPTEKAYSLEYRFKHKDGQYRWFHDRFTVMRDEAGHPLARIGSVSDITDRKLAEENQQKTMRELQTILDTANVGISLMVDRKQLWVNQKAVDLFQYSKEEMEGQTTRKLYPTQEAYEQLGKDAYPCLSLGHLYETEQKLIRRDGTPIWVKYNGRAIEPKDLSKGTIWILEDVTERKQAEKLLLESKENYHRVFENKMIAICVFDAETLQMLDINDAHVQLYGYSREESLGGMRSTDMSAEPETSREFIQSIKSAKSFSVPLRDHKKKDGTIFPVEIVGNTYMRAGRLVILAMIRDISHRRQAEEVLVKVYGELERKVLERTIDLEKTNATLAMMLDYARKTETDIQERVVSNLRANILGIVDVLKKQQLAKSTLDLVELLETTTLNLAHPIARNLESQLLKLTAREIQLANFIRLGKSTKELVDLLNISKKTVESHRDNLRKKLGIQNKKINLRTFLNSEFAE